jgi:predicted nucleic acid-binding protein
LIVVDASVAAKWVLREPDTPAALALLATGDLMAAPELLRLEGAGAITRALRAGRIEREFADNALQHWLQYLASGTVELLPDSRDLARASHLSCDLRHPLPDCLYLALAERLGCELLTADATFARRAPAAYPNVRLFDGAAAGA